MQEIKLINFTQLSLDEKKLILKWRNNPLIKKWMYTSEDISFEKHLSFIESLRLRKDKLYFLVQENNEKIGVIDFTNITSHSLDMGLYLNPSIRGKGAVLLEQIVQYSFDILKVQTINAEVFSINKKAYELYKRFNFIDVSKKNINNKEVICMELRDENR